MCVSGGVLLQCQARFARILEAGNVSSSTAVCMQSTLNTHDRRVKPREAIDARAIVGFGAIDLLALDGALDATSPLQYGQIATHVEN